MAEAHKLSDTELKNLVQHEIDQAIGYLMTTTVADRKVAMDYYLRHPYGNEVEGKSQIVTGEVAEAVNGALPQLIKIFTSYDETVKFEPVKAGDEPFAEQATQLANWVFNKDNDGFMIMHHWFKDALLQKVGVVKAYWEVNKDETKEKYQGLTDDELALLLQDQEFEVIKHKENVAVGDDGQPYVTHDVTIKRSKDKSRIKIENVPPEEFLISKNARSIQDTPFVAQRSRIPRGDLVAMGFSPDQVDKIPLGDRLTYAADRLARYSPDEMPKNNAYVNHSMEEVEVFECYIRADLDGDGINELHRIVYAGNEIMEDVEVDYIPFHIICPVPVPYKVFGQSLADQTVDIQLVKSTILRQMLDNLYLTNNTRMAVVEGKVNLDDLLSSTAGGVIRTKDNNAIMPLTVQSSAAQSFPMMEYMDNQMAKRTGVSDMQQGLDPSVLQNTTATAVAAVMQQSAGKLELIARIFAESGVKSLFKGILHLLCAYQDKAKTIRINGKFVDFNPREWSNQYEVSVNVGLGNGNRQEQIAMLQMIMAKQEEILKTYGANNPLVSVKQYRETLDKLIQMAGFKDTSGFMNEITPEAEQAIMQQAMQPPPADPSIEATKELAAVEREKNQLTAMAKTKELDLKEKQMTIDAAQRELEMNQKAALSQAEIALEQIKLALDTSNQDEQTRMQQTQMVMETIGKINQMLQGYNQQ